MGQCKICGTEIEEGKEICDSCQQDLGNMDVEMDNLGDFDIDLEDFVLPELSGDLMETDLEFKLDDPDNNLENPDIFIHDMVKEASSLEEDVLTDTMEDEKTVNIPEEKVLAETTEVQMAGDILDLPEDLGDLLSSASEKTADETVDLSSLLPESEMPGMGLDGLDLTVDEVSGTDEDKSFVDDILGSIDAGNASDSTDATANVGDVLSGVDGADVTNTSNKAGTDILEDPLGGMADDILNLFPSDSITQNATIESGISDLGEEPNLDILGAVPDAEEIAELAKPKEKISMWKRLFGNIKDEKWEKQKEKEANEEAAKLAKIEEQKAKEAEAATETEGSEGEPKIDPKEAKKAAKLAKKEEKAKRKEEKKAEKQRLKELAELEDADEGRINRLGAAIVFVFLGIVAAFVIIGTNVFSYSGSINRASAYFVDDQYSAAYNEISGVEVKEKDKELYEQIRTVMFVNKELNSYQNYTGIRMYPEALDSLIKGLEKYDRHIDDAKDLDVSEDLDKVRGRILSELKKEYGLSEKEAYKLLDTTNQETYSKKVIEIANQ